VGTIIEHSDNGNSPSVRVGEGESQVSVKVYQDVYHQVTGRTEQIRKRYTENILVEFSEIEQLHYKVMQLSDVHNVVAHNEVVSVFHEKERKEQFTSFERFRAYNANASSPSVNLVLKYNFSIIPAGLDRPQEYAITIRLTSRVAIIKQIEIDKPPFMDGSMLSMLAANTAEINIDYTDYIIARGFLEAFDEWIHGCKSTPDIALVSFLKQYSHFLPGTLKGIVVPVLIIFFSLKAVPDVFVKHALPELWARFFIIFFGSFYLLTNLMGISGRMIENAIDGHLLLSYLKLNKGDNKIIEESGRRNRFVFLKFFMGCVLTVVLGYISSKLANLI